MGYRGWLVVLVLLVSASCWRIWLWRGWVTQIQSGSLVSLTVRLTEPVKKMDFSCLISYRGILIQGKTSLCDSVNLWEGKSGDEVQIMGQWQWWDETRMSGSLVIQKASLVQRNKRDVFVDWHGRLVYVFRQGLPEPEAGLVAGIVVGADGHFSDTFKSVLQRTGTMHMVAASGYNVAIVIGFLLPFLVWMLGRKWGSVTSGVLVWGYVLLAGSSPSVVRAGLMGLGLLLGQAWGRMYWAGWVLFVVATGMVISSPWLVADISFQLSVLATVGVMMGYKPKTPLLDSLSTTTAAVIMTAPISLWHFGQVSWLGLVVNPLVLWLVPPLTYLGSLMATLGIIWLPLSTVVAWLVEPIAWLLVRTLEVVGSVAFGVLSLNINGWIMIGWWVIWVGIWSFRPKRNNNL